MVATSSPARYHSMHIIQLSLSSPTWYYCIFSVSIVAGEDTPPNLRSRAHSSDSSSTRGGISSSPDSSNSSLMKTSSMAAMESI
ncbi:hypothetical protein AAC387_Pa02g3248 [Persea americana]